MWCQTCRQDVPGLISPAEKCYCCARCGTVLKAEAHHSSAATTEPAADAVIPEAPSVAVRFDPWELNERLRHIQRVLHHGQPATARMSAMPMAPTESMPAPEPAAKSGVLYTLVGSLAWLLLGTGMMVLVCGGALVVQSLLTGRDELREFGLPAMLGGQSVLMIGLLVFLVRRRAKPPRVSVKAPDMEAELTRIRQRLTTAGAVTRRD
jgi:hypothetical protein